MALASGRGPGLRRRAARVNEVDWGTVPAWISGVGGTIALLMTIRIVKRDHKLRESSQAEDVYAAIVAHHWKSSSGRFEELRLKAINSSSAPVFRMTIEILGRDWKRSRSTSEANQGKPITSRLIPSLMPHQESQELDLDREVEMEPWDDATSPWVTPPVRFSFTDAAGRRWTRWPDGCLVRHHQREKRSARSA